VAVSVTIKTVMVRASPGMGASGVGAITSLIPPGMPVNLPMVLPRVSWKVAVTPGARCPTLNLMAELNPFFELRVRVVLPVKP
jgi:hypothetical protein